MNAHRSTRRLFAESLEDRLALAGDVYAYGYTQPSTTYSSPAVYGSYEYGTPRSGIIWTPGGMPTYGMPANPEPGVYYPL